MLFYTKKICLLILLTSSLWLQLSAGVVAQTATIQGIITSEEAGLPLEGANIMLENLGDGTLYGMAAGSNGLYQLSGFSPGEYELRVSFVGYITYNDTLTFGAGQRRTVSVTLAADEEQLEVLTITTPGTGAAGLVAGRQRVKADDFRRVPSPAADLTSYLQTMPGVVSSGDRG